MLWFISTADRRNMPIFCYDCLQYMMEGLMQSRNRIQKSLKSRFESEIRAKIFSKSAYSFAYSPPSLWNARYRFNLRYPQGFCNFLRCFLGPLSADCTKEKGHTFHSCKNDIEIRFPYSTDRFVIRIHNWHFNSFWIQTLQRLVASVLCPKHLAPCFL